MNYDFVPVQTAITSGGSDVSPDDVDVPDGAGSLLISSFSSLPGLKYGTFFGGTSTLSPVFGLRPFRGSRLRRRKLPKPRSSIFSPRCKASMMLLNTVSTMTSECFFVRSETRETSSTSSAFVMLPAPLPLPLPLPIVTAYSLTKAEGPLPCGPGPQPFGLPVSKVIAERRRPRAFTLLVRLPVAAELVVLHRADAQANLALLRAQLDDLHLVGGAHFQIDLLAALRRAVRVVELGHVNQPFDPFIQLDEGAEVGHAGDLSFNDAADLMTGEEVVPDIGGKLLQAQRQALVVGVDAENHGFDDVALLQHLGRMLDALAPRHVGDVNQAVDVFFDLHECAELGEIADLALDARAHRILLGQLVPRVGLDLLEAERNATRRRIHAEHHRIDGVADVENLRWMLDALAPRHLGDV